MNKTRIKETTKIVDGQTVVVYQAQFWDLWKWFNWRPILGYKLWQRESGEWVECIDDTPFKTEHKRGSLEFCKDLIDYVINLEKEEIEYKKTQAAIKKSTKVKYIRYP